MTAINTELKFFCPRAGCKSDEEVSNSMTKDGVYTTKGDREPRQMFDCHGGQHRCSATGSSELFGKHGNFKEEEQTAKLSGSGLGTSVIAAV